MLKASTTLLLKRGYATTAAGFTEHSLKNGIKIAASSGSNSTGAISVVIAAGSRQQQSAGVATVVKHALFKVSGTRPPLPIPVLFFSRPVPFWETCSGENEDGGNWDWPILTRIIYLNDRQRISVVLFDSYEKRR